MRLNLRVGVLSATIVLAACATPEQLADDIAERCGAAEGFAVIAPPSNALEYRSAASAEAAVGYRRSRQYQDYWYRDAEHGRTILCNLNPRWRPTRDELCNSRRPALNEYSTLFLDTPTGPKSIGESIGGICVT